MKRTNIWSMATLLLLLLTMVGCSDKELDRARVKVETVNQLESAKYIAPAQAAAARTNFVDQASKAVGRKVTIDEVMSSRRIQGVLNTSQVLFGLGGLLVGVGLLYVLHPIIIKLLKSIPALAWEYLSWGVCIGFALNPKVEWWVALVSCVCMVGAMAFTVSRHQEWFGSKGSRTLASLLLCLVWGFVAVRQESAVIGILSCLAFASAIGFTGGVGSLCYFLGFEEKATIPQATVIAGIMAFLGGVLTVFGQNGTLPAAYQSLLVFRAGLTFVGMFGFFLGLLISSSRWVATQNYWRLQIITLVAGIGALWLGGSCDIPYVEGISGTFLGLFVLEKYGEWVCRKVNFGWALLGLGGILWVMAKLMAAFPSHFLLHL